MPPWNIFEPSWIFLNRSAVADTHVDIGPNVRGRREFHGSCYTRRNGGPQVKTVALLLGLIIMPATAHTAELKVLAGGSITASLKELAPKFEKASGHRLDITFAATPDLIKMATSAPSISASCRLT